MRSWSAFLLVLLVGLVRSDSSDHRYKPGDFVPLYANKVGPFHNPRLVLALVSEKSITITITDDFWIFSSSFSLGYLLCVLADLSAVLAFKNKK